MPTKTTILKKFITRISVGLLCILMSNSISFAQSCLDNGLILVFQSEVDAFPSLYPGCTTIEGGVYLENGFGGDISNLDSLIQIKNIKGSLSTFYTQELSSLKGLDSLENIGGSLRIQLATDLRDLSHLDNLKNVNDIWLSDNENLKNLEGLNNLETVSGNINIINNDSLDSFKGLEKLKKIGGDLNISNNYSLKFLNGLNNLKTVRNFYLTDNFKLRNLTGLESLETITLDFTIEDNEVLNDLEGLNALEFIGGHLMIGNNYSIKNLNGIGPVNFIGLESISIFNNRFLESLDGINNLGLNGVSTIYIAHNPNLNLCAVNSICNYLSICKNPIIHDNANPCNELDDLVNDCIKRTDYKFQWNCPISVYPNPSAGFLNVRINSDNEVGTINYEIVDATGRLLMSGYQFESQIDVSNLTTGVYYLTIQTALQTEMHRFVKI